MKLFGLEITRAKAVPDGLQTVSDRGAWYPIIREPFTGAWQQNREIRRETILANHAVFACLTIISSDIAKCGMYLKQRDPDGIWIPVSNPAYTPVLRRPNGYQTFQQFVENWVISKLIFGNTYVLLERDNRNVVVAMYVLDPLRTKALVAPDQSVYYQIGKDNLSGLEEDVTVPATEVIHDRWPITLHPLMGMPPLMACNLAASTSQNIQSQSDAFFHNGARPGGLITSTNVIKKEEADAIRVRWEDTYRGHGYGRIAVMGNGFEYKSIVTDAVDAQLVEQLGSAGKIVTTAFNVPAYMVGVGETPDYNNIEALNYQYYSQCLQKLIEAIEGLVDYGLGLADDLCVEFDIENLIRMDTATKIKSYAEAITGGLMKPDEGRAKLNLPKVKGGDAVYLQQQNYSLEALAKRDAQDNPFAKATDGVSPATVSAPAAADNGEQKELQLTLLEQFLERRTKSNSGVNIHCDQKASVDDR